MPRRTRVGRKQRGAGGFFTKPVHLIELNYDNMRLNEDNLTYLLNQYTWK